MKGYNIPNFHYCPLDCVFNIEGLQKRALRFLQDDFHVP